jgi:hypothetical protein
MNRAALLVALAACGDNVDGIGVDATGEELVGACDGVVRTIEARGGTHVPSGFDIEFSTNPPATGAHYPQWAGWDRSYENLNRGNWLHNAEHGGVILLWNCPDGCQDVVDQLLDIARNANPDPSCTAPITKRVIVARDLLLPETVQVAAVAWNAYYTASCFDPYVATFMRERYRRAPEDTCADGVPFGGVRIEPTP